MDEREEGGGGRGESSSIGYTKHITNYTNNQIKNIPGINATGALLRY